VGQLAHFDLTGLADRFGLRSFIETGTGRGDSLAYACRFSPPLTRLHSCEVHPALAAAAVSRFAGNPLVQVHSLRSTAFLDRLLPVLPDRPALFWLDAHFPGADYGLAPYDDTLDPAVRLPLRSELDLIHLLRPLAASRDVILIDDARIWLDLPFGSGPLPDDIRPLCPAGRDIAFIQDLFNGTHDIHVDLSHEGYVMLTPREPPSATGRPRSLLAAETVG